MRISAFPISALPPPPPPMSTIAVFLVGTLMVPPSSSSKESESELEAVSMYTHSARLDPVSSVSSSSLEDNFLEDFLAVQL